MAKRDGRYFPSVAQTWTKRLFKHVLIELQYYVIYSEPQLILFKWYAPNNSLL